MKRERRQELQTNTLAKWLAVKVQAVKPYVTWIVGGLVAIVLVAVVVSIRSQRESTASAEGWNRFQEANTEGFNALNENKTLELQDAVKRLESLAGEYSGTTLEHYVRLAIGDLHLRSGQSQVRSNHAAAKQHFKDAANQYEQVSSKAAELGVKSRATFCLAKSYEWMYEFTKAKAAYGKVEGPYRSEAQMRLNNLEQPSTIEFYDKLAKWEPPPPPPPFSLDPDVPPEDAEIDYRDYLDETVAGDDLSPAGGEVPPPEPSRPDNPEAPAESTDVPGN